MREPDKEHLLMHGFALSRVMRASFSFSFSIYQQTLRRSCSGALCVSVCVFVCLSALPTRLLLTPTPPTLWIMRSNHAHYQPYTLFVPSSFIHSFLYSLSLYRLFGWSNVQVTFDNYY